MKIIISRTDAIGDVILTLPLAGLIKQKVPQSTIIFLAKSYTIPVIQCCKNIDKIINYSELETLNINSSAKILSEYEADIILHVFPDKKIAKLSKMAKIPKRIGTRNRLYHWNSCTNLINISRKNSLLHESQLNLKFIEFFGFDSNLTLSEISELYNFNPPKESPVKLSSNKKNIILHPKSAGSAREWGINNFNKLVSILPKDRFNFFITGTNTEKKHIEEEFDFSPTNTFNLLGKLNLTQLISFIYNCDALVAASTGPLHIASAAGIHAIGLFPPIRPMDARRWAPVGKKSKYFTKDIKCSKCRTSNICTCMHEISPEDIAEYVLSIFN